jgi:hypothetical protein
MQLSRFTHGPLILRSSLDIFDDKGITALLQSKWKAVVSRGPPLRMNCPSALTNGQGTLKSSLWRLQCSLSSLDCFLWRLQR